MLPAELLSLFFFFPVHKSAGSSVPLARTQRHSRPGSGFSPSLSLFLVYSCTWGMFTGNRQCVLPHLKKHSINELAEERSWPCTILLGWIRCMKTCWEVHRSSESSALGNRSVCWVWSFNALDHKYSYINIHRRVLKFVDVLVVQTLSKLQEVQNLWAVISSMEFSSCLKWRTVKLKATRFAFLPRGM